MIYKSKDYNYLLGTPGFSDKALETHFALYQGYVTNTYKILERLEKLRKIGQVESPEYAELKRRFGWEFNGMRLHEDYFRAMKKGGAALEKRSKLARQIAKDFGSIAAWQKDFAATALIRGIGWAILYFDTQAKRLFNVWVNEHDVGHLVNNRLILNLDVFEHVYIIDYGPKRPGYIEAYLKAVDWAVAAKRFEAG